MPASQESQSAAGAADPLLVPGDFLLQFLVKEVDAMGFSMSITLHVGGTIVTGDLASVREYSRYLSKEFASAIRAEDPKETASQLTRAFEENENLLTSDRYLPRFAHVKDAELLTPGGAAIARISAPWWRGRLSSIDAFVLGKVKL